MNDKLTTFDFSQVDEASVTNNANNITGTGEGELLIGTSSSEPITGFGGDDIIVGKDGSDTLIGGTGNDELITGRGNNLLLGNDGDDILIASNYRLEEAGNNVFNGGAGNDFLIGDEGNDLLTGAADDDLITGAGGRDNILGGAGIDGINGGAGDDRILGENGDDLLEGGDGNDLIFGGNGLDTLAGLEGFDTLNGGAEADFFVLIPNTERDLIADFQKGEDKLILFPTLRFDSPLTFEQLSINQENNSTVISVAETNETLAVLDGVAASSIDSSDFMDIEELENESAMMNNSAMAELLSQIPPHSITDQTEAAGEDEPPLDIPESIGAVTSQGVEVINADEARSRFGVDGSGITVGVLGDSFDRNLNANFVAQPNITAQDDVATGDLPGEGNPNNYNTPVSVLDDSANNSLFLSSPEDALIDEGRALAQIVTDVAPGANILFRTAFKGPNDFARGIDELVAAGADVIVDDVSSPIEPFFQDGVVAQAANRAVDAGIPYFSSAGNSNRNSYEAEFRPVAENTLDIKSLERYTFHDFNPGEEVDILQNFTLEPGEGINLSFQWDEPFASAGGIGASSDLDIFVLDADNNVVELGAESNIDTDALEQIAISNPTEAPVEYKLLIGQNTEAGGEAPNTIKYIDFGGGTSEAEYFTNSPTVFGQQNAEDVSSVGASDYRTPQHLEEFSSVGIVPILFDEQGNRLPEPELRQKPDIIAPNGVNTTFFGQEDLEEDGFLNFSGTSAASPHAAGVAALLLDAVPDATPQEVYGALEQTALDLDNPFTPEFDTGYDTATGFGLIQADAALESLLG